MRGPLVVGVTAAVVGFVLGAAGNWIASTQSDLSEQRSEIIRQSTTIDAVRSELSRMKQGP